VARNHESSRVALKDTRVQRHERCAQRSLLRGHLLMVCDTKPRYTAAAAREQWRVLAARLPTAAQFSRPRCTRQDRCSLRCASAASSWPASNGEVRHAVLQMDDHHRRQPGATLPPHALYHPGTTMPTCEYAVHGLGKRLQEGIGDRPGLEGSWPLPGRALRGPAAAAPRALLIWHGIFHIGRSFGVVSQVHVAKGCRTEERMPPWRASRVCA
jgi:hypothetical protein